MNNLKELESKTTQVIRECIAKFKNPAVLWSMGKDSTVMLDLIRKAHFNTVPMPVVHLDTGVKFQEMYEFRDKLTKEWDLNLIISKINDKSNPKDNFNCCMKLKTNNLKKVLKEYKFDALILAIRRDEHVIRNIERYFSPRDKDLNWHIVRPKTKEELKTGDSDVVSEQPVELWDLWQTDFGKECNHIRVHPILHWNEIDVWNYIQKYNVPTNPLYFSKYGRRYRSLGCQPCTTPINSNANTINKIIKELSITGIKERSGRKQDKESLMRKLRSLGYM